MVWGIHTLSRDGKVKDTVPGLTALERGERSRRWLRISGDFHFIPPISSIDTTSCQHAHSHTDSLPEHSIWWGTEACRWSRGQVVSEVAGAARVKGVCGAWPPALADFGISALGETPSRSPASGPKRWRGVLRVCTTTPLGISVQRPCSVEPQPALGSHPLSFPSLLQQILN